MFTGFPVAALDFYEDLEADNSKAFWAAHKAVYDDCVRGPMRALLGELEDEFGEGKMFRPYRDVRFSRDKIPYKTHQGGYVATGPGIGSMSRSMLPGCGSPADPTLRHRLSLLRSAPRSTTSVAAPNSTRSCAACNAPATRSVASN